MGKATNASIPNLSLEQAAIGILALIKRTQAPPTIDEIKTILKKMAWVPDADWFTALGEVRRIGTLVRRLATALATSGRVSTLAVLQRVGSRVAISSRLVACCQTGAATSSLLRRLGWGERQLYPSPTLLRLRSA